VPIDVSPDRLATAWPTLLRKRIRLRASVERAVDFTQVIVRAGGRSFLVSLAPAQIWSGSEAHVFRVLGRGIAPIHGRTMMVELVLDEDEVARADGKEARR
jgi:hypothetical protein